MFIAALFTIPKTRKHSNCPLTINREMERDVVYIYNGTLLSYNKGTYLSQYYEVDEP